MFARRSVLIRRTVVALAWGWVAATSCLASPKIDRHALVSRHDPELHAFDAWNPFSLGNGDFAFTADATGLQTFAASFTNTIPLSILSQWGWHSFPNPNGWSIEKFHFKEFDVCPHKALRGHAPKTFYTREGVAARDNPQP